MKTMLNQKIKQCGASIFLVVVSCMFVAIIVASFVRLMIRDQQQASQQDISQSAYDSAQAGVEDAKRFMNIWLSECQSGQSVSNDRCSAMSQALQAAALDTNGGSCNILNSAGVGSASGETMIQSSSSSADTKLDQAYTCVKLQMDTEDYLGELSKDGSATIRLKPVATAKYIRISWHTSKDTSSESVPLDNFGIATNIALPTSWTTNKPAVVTAQLAGINFASAHSGDSLDNPITNGTGSGKITLFPSSSSTAYNSDSRPLGFQVAAGADAVRRDASTSQKVYPTSCKASLSAGGYACSVLLSVPDINPGDSQYTILRLNSLYTSTNYKVEMLDASRQVVKFNGIQPKVDSTGRANDRFRRVESRIEAVDNQFPVPDFAVSQGDSGNKLCKDFWVTNLSSGFSCE